MVLQIFPLNLSIRFPWLKFLFEFHRQWHLTRYSPTKGSYVRITFLSDLRHLSSTSISFTFISYTSLRSRKLRETDFKLDKANVSAWKPWGYLSEGLTFPSVTIINICALFSLLLTWRMTLVCDCLLNLKLAMGKWVSFRFGFEFVTSNSKGQIWNSPIQIIITFIITELAGKLIRGDIGLQFSVTWCQYTPLWFKKRNTWPDKNLFLSFGEEVIKWFSSFIANAISEFRVWALTTTLSW